MASQPSTHGNAQEQTLPLETSEALERVLAARIRAGDYEAFTALFHTYYGRLLAFALRLTSNRDLAEDVVQDVFVQIWERRAGWGVTTSVTAYLCGATRNGIRREHRRHSVRERFAPWIAESMPEVDVEIATHDAQVDAIVARAITTLPERCQAVYSLRWHDQLTYGEIAHILGISVKTVEAHVTAALRVLRPRLKHLLDSSVPTLARARKVD